MGSKADGVVQCAVISTPLVWGGVKLPLRVLLRQELSLPQRLGVTDVAELAGCWPGGGAKRCRLQRCCTLIESALVALLSFVLLSTAQAASYRDVIRGENVRANSKAYRAAVADDLMQLFLPLHASMPKLSPEQQVWLKLERRRIASIGDPIAEFEQFRHLRFRLEFHISRSKRAIGNIIALLQCLQREKIINEMLCWNYLSWQLMQEDYFSFMNSLYTKGKLVVPQSHTHIVEDEGYERFYYPLGRGLLQYIVQPYFKNKEESQFPPQPDKLKHMRLEGDMELFLHQLQPQAE